MTTNKNYVAVLSWLVSFYEDAIDDCTHAFAIPEGTEPEEMRVLISNILGTRCWCYLEDTVVTPEEFNDTAYDSIHDLTQVQSV